MDFYKKIEETRRVHQQNKLFKYELEEKIKEKQIEQMDKQPSTQKKSGIYMVNEIEHSIKCSNLEVAQSIAPEYLHYKYSNNIQEQ